MYSIDVHCTQRLNKRSVFLWGWDGNRGGQYGAGGGYGVSKVHDVCVDVGVFVGKMG